ncbi:hypothetical protein [Subtercola endophyticus]|uniref:hypothetical protein n=1 Tax=Subtercola endophyticus TaxID=2895559 RepID=UPI001E597E59|nr:hypothetical protein [Subtercola endophyticus]UFS60252.1 hypothetical protein LQ955_05715 [Subtercola endophyticus]
MNRVAWVALGVAVTTIATSLGVAAALTAPGIPSPAASSGTGSGSGGSGSGSSGAGALPTDGYPWHTNIVSTTFWVGEVFDPSAADGSQVYSTYDSNWYANYGGCDGTIVGGVCQTEARTAANGYFPSAFTPKQNPFYLDLPFDDVNDPAAFARRGSVIPWASQPEYASRVGDPSYSLMKNRWVELRRGSQTCFGQIEDAGPGQYNDANYVFGSNDARPENARYGGAGMDVSPALNGCLGFSELNGDTDQVSWRFVDDADVAAGPWMQVVTTSGVQ